MINELNENSKSFRSIENSELDSLKKKSERDSYLKSEKNLKKSRNNNNPLITSQSSHKVLIPKISSTKLTTKENRETRIETTETNNNNKNYRPYTKDQDIISNDIRDFQQKTECTYYQYGNFPVYQKVYFCDFCDTNSTEKICENCYFDCHSNCFANSANNEEDANSNGIPDNLFINYDEEENLKFMHGKFLTFICSCGLKKHKLKQVNDDTGTLQCNFLNLDIKLKNRAMYSCISCNVDILCFICYIKCHKNCVTKKLLTDDPDINKGKACGCGNNINHCNRFILNKFMSYIFHKQNNYDTIPYVLKIQLLNCIYDCDIYELLYTKITNFVLENYNKKRKIDEIEIETLKRLVFNITQVKRFYYFHENIKNTLPLKNINSIIQSINQKELLQYASFISGLMNIIVNVHFKSDFQKVKCFTYRDFLFTSLLQRIIMKKKFYSKCLYIKDITQKYIINGQCTIPNLCIECLNILNKILKQSEEKDILDIFDKFSIVFEMTHFCLTRSMADKKSLIKIIFLLEKVCLLFYLNTKNILTDGVDIYNEIVNIRKIRKITDYISKIIYMIITNFNDAIVEEKLNLNKDKSEPNKKDNSNNIKKENEQNALNSKFIQTLSSHSKKLFKIMSSTSIVYNTFILDNKINLKDNDVLDLLDFVNQGLEAFTLIDNSYFNLFNKISFSDYFYFEKTISKINNYEKIWDKYQFSLEKRNLFNSINNQLEDKENNEVFKDLIDNNSQFNNNCDTYEELISESDTSNIEKTIIMSCYNNKEKIETLYKLYFHSKIKFTDVDTILYSILSSFDKSWKEEDKRIEKEKKEIIKSKTWTSSFFSSKKQEVSEKDKEEIMNMNLFLNEKESLIEQKKIINYWNKIILILKNSFPNMIYMDNILEDNQHFKDKFILNKEIEAYFDIILNELVLSNFDCTLTPFLIMDPVMNRYSDNTINIIFKFLLFYTLSKQSLIYLLSGNTLNNILKILDIYPLQVLQFISQISEGIYLYDIDFHQHEQIPKLLNQIYNFIKKNISMKDEYSDINNIRKCIIYTMDILYYLSPNMEIENLTSINELIVEQLQRLIDQEKIINMFPFQGLIHKYQEEKKMNLYLEEKKEDLVDNIDDIILEDKSYLMNYIKQLFDNKIGKDDKFFPIDNANYFRKEYQIIEYKEKDNYHYKLSEENKNYEFSADDNINNEIINDNNPISNLVNKDNIKEEEKKDNEINIKKNESLKEIEEEKEKEIINEESKFDNYEDNKNNISIKDNINNLINEEKKSEEQKSEKKKSEKQSEEKKSEEKKSEKKSEEKKTEEKKSEEEKSEEKNNIVLIEKIDSNDSSKEIQKMEEINNILNYEAENNKIEEEKKKNEEDNNNSINTGKSGKNSSFRKKKRNKTMNPKTLKASENSSDSLKKIAFNIENQNKSPFSNLKFTSNFSSKFNAFKLGNNNQLVRNSTAFKSKLISNIFNKEKTSVINEESSNEKSSSQKKKDKNGKINFDSSNESKNIKLKKSYGSSDKSFDEDNQKDKKEKIKNNQELFFSIIKLLSNITYFFMKKNDVFDTFLKINDLSFYQLLLKENYLTLEERTNLLVFIRMVYINDQIDDQNSLVLDKYMNNQEYYENLKKLREIFEDESITYLPISLEDLKSNFTSEKQMELIEDLENNNSFNRFDNLKNLKIVIEILIHEIKNIFYLIYIEQNYIIINEYITQLIFTVKIISDIFITYNICSHITIWFYELTKEFLSKLNFFISYLQNSKTRLDLHNLDISEYVDNNILEMEQKNFDIYNKEKIYEYILEGFQLIYSQNDFSQKFKLNTFLHNFSEKDEKNFKNFTLNKTDIPFYAFNYDFYEEKNMFKKNNNGNFEEFKRLRKSMLHAKADKRKEINNEIKFENKTKKISENFRNFMKIKDNYVDEFNQFFSSTFYESICCSSYETTLDCNKIFLNYCVVYLHNLRLLPSDSIVLFLSMLNKLLTFEPIKTQATLDRIFTLKNRLLNKDNNINQKKIYFEETFFKNLTLILLEKININIATCKNIVIAERYEKINYVTKILIQFFQLLGEGHNKLFHNLIVMGKKDINIIFNEKDKEKDKDKESIIEKNSTMIKKTSISNMNNNINIINNINNNNSIIESNYLNNISNNVNVFQILCQSLNHVIRCFINYQNLILKGDLPYDKLIVMAHNIIDFIIEFFQGTDEKIYKIMYNYVNPIFPNMRKFLFLSIDTEEDIENFLKKEFSLQKVIYNKKIFVYTFKIELILLICSLLEEGNALRKNSNSLKDILEYFHPTDLYQSGVLSFHNLETYLSPLKEINLADKDSVNKLIELYKYNEKFQISIELKYFTKIFYYLRLLSDLYEREEVKSFLTGLKKTYNLYEIIPKKVEKNISLKSNRLDSIRVNKLKAEEKVKKEPLEKVNYVMYLFANKLLRKIEIKSDIHFSEQKGESRDFTFFLIPPICLLLSQQSINYFYNNVDRSSVHYKITGLITETDYFICEMFYHKLYQMNYGTFKTFLRKINIQLVEKISYLFIVIQNIILVVHFYSEEMIPIENKSILYLPNMIVGIVHIALMVFGLIIWFYFVLNLEVIHNYMQNYKVKFLFRDNDTENENRQSHFATLNEGVEDLSKLMDKLYSQIPLSKKLYTILFESIIFNNKVNIILLTLLFEIIFLITGNGILLAIPTLFIANMMSLLRGIFLIFKLRWSQLLLVLTYCYLIVYNFSIFGFYYLNSSFKFNPLYNVDIDYMDESGRENLCGSLLQCYLTLLSYGVRSGGGIGDVLPKLSFKVNASAYIGRFFFDILFHIIIVLIMTNLIFGIIVDSFAAFRGSTDDSEKDKKNVCFICQLTRDDAINLNIDFDKHVREVHDMWNYVYFLTYLHINNSNNFKMLETSVWDKLEESDTSWIPIKEE